MVAVLLAILVAGLAGPRLGLTGRSCLLIRIGTAICGVSAIVAVAPVLRARKEEIGLALATILSFNAGALLLCPLIGGVFAVDPVTFGTWPGVAVHDTASAVATGFALGPRAGEVATLVKLVRTLHLIRIMVLAVLAVLNSAGLLLGLGGVLNDRAKQPDRVRRRDHRADAAAVQHRLARAAALLHGLRREHHDRAGLAGRDRGPRRRGVSGQSRSDQNWPTTSGPKLRWGSSSPSSKPAHS
ncbi:MAG: YeiH family protein [Nitriliruptorales bacterium]